jgi:hypothetical protein
MKRVSSAKGNEKEGRTGYTPNSRGDDLRDHRGQSIHAAVQGRSTLDDLEPLRHVVDVDEVSAHHEGDEDATQQDRALKNDGERNHSIIALVVLPYQKHGQQARRTTEQADHGGRVPGILVSSPLQGEESHDDGGDKHGAADEVDLQHLISQGALVGRALRRLEKQGQRD